MLSMLVDSINEKAMDAMGDTVIAFDGDVPEVIEDYRGELEALVPERPDDSIQVSPPAGAAKG
ncbi:TerB-C domain-containing protein [Lachnospiraceae bacterium NK3A20]|nr:TerB-C domain-containing protein [Lachnospiraceae bacterium NK3A20]